MYRASKKLFLSFFNCFILFLSYYKNTQAEVSYYILYHMSTLVYVKIVKVVLPKLVHRNRGTRC